MSEKITDTCLCGAVRISCGEPAGAGGYCHCEDCRKSTGSAFGVNIPFEASEFRIISGEIRSFTKTADSGNDLTRHFCPNCGSPLFGTSPQHPGRIYVRAGIIDQPSLVRPASQTWCESKVEWSAIDPRLPSYPEGRP
ncbi:GFA family protein [Ensifer sp. CCNWLY38]|uniref:GFA family protein n=1 Tax=unclassified Ensifer TaxID=2633371 RepID=UPI003FA5FAEC